MLQRSCNIVMYLRESGVVLVVVLSFWNLSGFRVPGNDILALDEVQTVLYTHMVITRFLYRSAGLNELQSLPKKAKVAAI